MNYSLTRATAWNLAGYLYLILASFISTPIIVHSLGVPTFGRYTLIVAVIVLASSIDLGLSGAAVRELSRQAKKHHHHIWASSQLLFILTGFAAAIISTLFVSRFEPISVILPLVFTHTLAGHILSHYLTLPQAHGRFDLFNLKTFIVGTANTLLAAALAYLGFGIEILLVGQLLMYFVTIILLARYCYRHFGILPTRAVISYSRELLAFGIKNQLGKLVGQIGAQYAKFLLVTVSPLAVSAYAIGQGIVLKLAGGITQVSTALYPSSSSRTGTPGIRSLYHRLQLGLLTLGILGYVLYSLFGIQFLSWWLGDLTLAESVHSVLTLLVPYFALLVLTPLPSMILDSHGRPGLTSLFAFVTIGLEVVLALFLLPALGLLAPPAGALISIIITTPMLLLVTSRVLVSKVK